MARIQQTTGGAGTMGGEDTDDMLEIVIGH
jgi:hypothetical protein